MKCTLWQKTAEAICDETQNFSSWIDVVPGAFFPRKVSLGPRR